MILLRNLSLAFGEQPLFQRLQLNIQPHQRIGLYGYNGAGKSTLLKVIAGAQHADEGSVHIPAGFTVAYMPQEVILQSDKSIIQETLSVFSALIKAEAAVAELEAKLKIDPDHLPTINAYAQACHDLIAQEAERKRAEAERILQGLGFHHNQMHNLVTSLSTGWKMRIVLAKLLLQKADFYLFDEPTNHLDMVAKEWFLRFLQNNNFGFLLVCHEKYYLNKLCTHILELEMGVPTLYSGNYDTFMHEKEARYEQLVGAYEAQQREIKDMQETINRFRASASKARMAQSMIKKLEKIERIVLPHRPPTASFTFPATQRSARTVLLVENLAYKFGEKQIFNNCSFAVERGNKIAIVAPNGVGKTTLINIISGKLPVQTGTITWGDNTFKAVFDQEQLQTLDLTKNVFENAEASAQQQKQERIRAMLGSFLFSGSAAYKKAAVLSGGERNRLGMVRVLLQQANVLLLDEPTNHLDIPSKEILLAALQAFDGTLIFVSHDHDFINELATNILELRADGSTLYHGNYEEYLYQKQYAAENGSPLPLKNSSSSTSSHNDNVSPHSDRKEVRTLEQKIAKTERAIATISETFADLEWGTPEFDAAQKKLSVLEKELQEHMQEWEKITH